LETGIVIALMMMKNSDAAMKKMKGSLVAPADI
jgi:hypothetical protein